jgi:hypothetical protein
MRDGRRRPHNRQAILARLADGDATVGEIVGKHNEGWTSCLNRLQGLFRS